MTAMRYAHNDGHTVLCFDDTGSCMLTGGTDGDVRVWQGIDDDDAVSHRIGDRVYAIAFKNERFYTASDNNSVQTHTYPDGSPDGIVTRFTAPVNHMCFNKSGTAMVAGSSDFTVKHVEVESSSQKVFHGHQAPVLSVSLHPKEHLIASAACDGSVKVWQVDNQECLKTWEDLLPKCSDVSLSKSLCRLSWSPDGKFLLVPGDKELLVFDAESWEKTVVTDPAFTQRLSLTAFAPNDQQVALGSCGGEIHILDWSSRKCVQTLTHEKKLNITAMAWKPGPGSSQIAICDSEGQLGVFDVSPTSDQAMDTDDKENQFAGVFDDDDDMLLQASSAPPDIDDDDSQQSIGAMKTKTQQTISPIDDDDDDDGDFLKDIKALPKDDDDASSIADSLPPVPSVPLVNVFKPTPLQRPFQPGSTPDHLNNRFMMWNSVGIVKQFVSEDENSIDVEFHDTSTHHAMHITNSLECHLADLSTSCLALACPAEDDSPSKLTCMHFGAWDGNKEWTVTLPDGEEAQALTVSEKWIAVATDARNVRVFTVGGVQRDLFSIPGPVVSLASHNSQLMIVYHAGMGIPGDQCLSVILLSVSGKKRANLNGSHLPLSPKSTLQWLGFSAEGSPFTLDSAGIIRRWNTTIGPSWVQVLDIRDHAKGKSDHYWIVGVNEHPQQLRCILCKGSRYPPTLPRPAVCILPFKLPLCEMNTEKSQYEESLMRTQLFASCLGRVDDPDVQEALRPATEALMKLFALSARSDREARALEVCELMSEAHTLQLAIKYATRLRHIQLAERISELAQERATAEEEEDEEECDTEEVVQETRRQVADNDEEDDEDVDDVEVNEDQDEENMEHSDSGPRLNLQPKETTTAKTTKSVLSRSNPFKVASQSSHSMKGSQVFDKITPKPEKSEKIIAPLPVSIRTNKSGQGKKVKTLSNMFSSEAKSKKKAETENKNSSKTPVSGFQLWLSEHREEIQEEHPDLSEEDLAQTAAERFRALSKEDRQSWSQRAKEGGSSPSDRKRKRSSGDGEEDNHGNKMSKKPLSQSTNNKLNSFAFSKD